MRIHNRLGAVALILLVLVGAAAAQIISGGGGGGGGGTGCNTVGAFLLLGNGTGGCGNYAGSGPLATHNFATTESSVGVLSGAQPGAADIAAGTFTGAFTFGSAPTMSGANVTSATLPSASVAPGTFTGAYTFSTAPTLSGANITSATVPTASLATVQGNGTKVQLSTGTTTLNDCVKYDTNGNTVDSGGACGGSGATPGFINTPTVTSGAATLAIQCTAAGCTDHERIANGSNSGTLTLTTPPSGTIINGQYIRVEVNDTGTAPSSVAWTPGTGVTLNTLVLGNTNGATACGVPPATGQVVYLWAWNSTTGNLTLQGCGPQPAPTSLAVALGGTGNTSLTANSVLAAGSTSTSAIVSVGPSATAGQVLTQATTSAPPTYQSKPYDVGYSISGTPGSSIIVPFVCTRTLNFPANFTSSTYPDITSQVSCGTNPSETDDYLIKAGGTQIGDVSLSTSCVPTWTTVGGATKTCTAGQRLELDGPATISGANIAITLAAHTP